MLSGSNYFLHRIHHGLSKLRRINVGIYLYDFDLQIQVFPQIINKGLVGLEIGGIQPFEGKKLRTGRLYAVKTPIPRWKG
jgi:hypothetical protein